MSTNGTEIAKDWKASNVNTVTENASVTLFREYLRIKTVQPNPDYATCIEFLTKVASCSLKLQLPHIQQTIFR
jgi:hypothetical protein